MQNIFAVERADAAVASVSEDRKRTIGIGDFMIQVLEEKLFPKLPHVSLRWQGLRTLAGCPSGLNGQLM